MLGLSISLQAIPGVGSLLSKLDSYKAQFLAVPDRVNKALDRLSILRRVMAQNNAPPSAQSDALQVEQTLRRVQSEWAVSAKELQTLQVSGLNVSLDTITTAGHLLSSMTYVLSNTKSIESKVDALAAKYLTTEQRNALNTYTPAVGGGLSMATLALIGVGAFFLLRGRRG